jgi:hypothetical protein
MHKLDQQLQADFWDGLTPYPKKQAIVPPPPLMGRSPNKSKADLRVGIVKPEEISRNSVLAWMRRELNRLWRWYYSNKSKKVDCFK